jgi:Double-GTPase 2
MKQPQCSESRCHAPKIACYRGETALDDCGFWHRSNIGASPAVADGNTAYSRLPWSGSALGTTDLGFLTARADPKLVAFLGPHNAGKTTLLAAWYLLLGRLGAVGDHLFAGSYSLEGWEAVAHALRWEGKRPSFPRHTSSGAGRAPGLLHLALRGPSGRLEDVLFADAPGEWFQRWAVESEAPDAAGARWLADRASVLAIVADCESLVAEDRGNARASMVNLIRRVAATRDSRPVALVWAKADINIPSAIRKAVLDAALLVMPDIEEFSVSVVDHEANGVKVDNVESLMALFRWSVAPLSRGVGNVETKLSTSDPFFAFGM